MVLFFITIDFWSKILVTADFCDVEFTFVTVKPKNPKCTDFVKIALSITD